MSMMEQAFWRFHGLNPHIYDALVTHGREWRKHRGPTSQVSIAQLFEVVRWNIGLGYVGLSLGTPRLSNNHKPYYARLIMALEADLGGLFVLHQLQEEPTFGPSNQEVHENHGQVVDMGGGNIYYFPHGNTYTPPRGNDAEDQ